MSKRSGDLLPPSPPAEKATARVCDITPQGDLRPWPVATAAEDRLNA